MPPVSVSLFLPAEGARILEAEGDGPRQVEVTIIRPCRSANGLTYSPRVLREATPLFEGAAAFADHPDALDLSRAGGRSIRDLVGVYHSARYEEGHGIKATLRFSPAGAWAAQLVEGFIRDREAGQPTPPLGISADLLVHKQPAGKKNGHRPGFDVVKIEAVNSADLVYRPAAGGTFDRLLEAIQDDGPPFPRREEPALSAAKGGQGVRYANPTHKTKEDTLPPNSTDQTDQTDQALEGAQDNGDTGAQRTLEAELAAVRTARLALCGDLLSTRLAASTLPAPAQDAIRSRFAGHVFEATELDAEITATRTMLGAIHGAGAIHGMGRPRASVGRGPVENITLAMERLFGLPLPDSASDVPKLSGIREAYILLTGDPEFTGRYNWERSIAREADEVTQAVMNDVISNVMNKRLVADYKGQPKWWAPLVSVVDLRDMRLQTRLLLNDFASLPTVAENGTYVNLAWGDTKETYTPVKKGSQVYVTMEMIINDDVRSIVRIPTKLAKAATVTINEYISALWTSAGGLGPALADGLAVFNAGHGANTGVAALDATSLPAAITNVRKHANSASKRLGINPKYLLVPVDLEWQARALVNSTLIPGSPNNDVNVLKGIVEPVVVPTWTDVNNWYLHPDPAEIETIELGFLNGRQEPELLVMDNPAVGTVFTNDAISWKVRWIFGAGWLDYRGCYGSIVA